MKETVETTDISQGHGVKVKFAKDTDFLKIKETLSRIGVASKKSNTLCQSCHILHKQGQYAIIHFKEIFLLDGKDSNISKDDLDRVNTITRLLSDWGLLEVVDKDSFAQADFAPLTSIKVLSYKEKPDWILRTKYSIGSRKH